MNTLLYLIIALGIFLTVCYIVHLIVSWMPLPEPLKNIVKIVLGLVALLVLLNFFGVFGEPWIGWPDHRRVP